ncbi:signal peptidase I [Neisseria leonii]|uniref:Signal peptidase I n=2 Tax=Neisseria leonii TaxID=2995413 RepID=A0AAQ3V0P0_9NEIS|nr:signal peptidase I [Neisseria sp. 51.81]
MTFWFAAALAAVAAGAVMWFKSGKMRTENGEWNNGLQWAYLLMLVGVFGLLASAMSFTAVLLVFVLFTGAVWLWRRLKVGKNRIDDNHFRDYMASFFPIIALIFVLRSFIAEPFQIPSGSMRPGLVAGDFILVNKFAYGIRTPVVNNVLIDTGKVARGDVMVFNYPESPQVNYIKRVIGLPGDLVEYRNKNLSINGRAVPDSAEGVQSYRENTTQYGTVDIRAEVFGEALGGRRYQVLKMPEQPAFLPQGVRSGFPFRENCEYAEDGTWFSCRVPEGHYFMLGDNRDNSEDSRYWGFVSDKLVVGKAFLIWMNFGDFSRVGKRIE